MFMHVHPEFYWTAVALVIVMSSARLTRLVTFDHFPPVARVRNWYKNAMLDHGDWYLLAVCGYCFSFWATAVVMVCADLAGVFDGKPVVDWFTPVWWLGAGALGASYLAAIVMKYDGDTSGDS